jgi:hypothetical protein
MSARYGYFYMFSTPDHPGVVTFGITRNVEVRFLYYDLPDMKVLGVWKFRSYEHAEQFERSVKLGMQEGRIESFAINTPGRLTESTSIREAIDIVKQLSAITSVVRVTWEDVGPWRKVSKDNFERRKGRKWP